MRALTIDGLQSYNVVREIGVRMKGRFVAYYRVSTKEQGQSGLGLEAQQKAVRSYLAGFQRHTLLGEYKEVETGKGSNALEKRPVLRQAMDAARKQKATLLIAKLDRLARNVHFVSGLIESGTDFIAVDNPQADKTMLHIYSAMAEWERDRISLRIREALAAKKARGEPVGNPANLEPGNARRKQQADAFARSLARTVKAYQRAGMTQRAIVDELNTQGIRTARAGRWSLVQLQRVLARL
jgi:DNA invertase Pin-like site-specific DNA recombinase